MSSEGSAVAIPTLDDLRTKITETGDKIKELKSVTGEVDKDAVTAAVKELLDLKRTFASRNDGIGVDGKKWEEPLSKSELKKKKKAEKNKGGGSGGAGGGGPSKEEADPNSESSKKKAAKKAEAKAKKAAMKAAAKGGGEAGGGGGKKTKDDDEGGGKKPPAAAAATTKKAAAPAKKAKQATTTPASSKSKLNPMELAFNPNAPLTDRPVLALTVAILTNTILDLNLVSDHTRSHDAGLGLPNNGGELVGDTAIARYLVRRAAASGGGSSKLLGGGGESVEEEALVDQWVDYALTISKFETDRKIRAVRTTLDRALGSDRTYVVGYSMTLADLALFASLGFPSEISTLKEVTTAIIANDEATTTSPTLRWMNMMSTHPAIREATQLALGIDNKTEAVFEEGVTLEPLVSGMNPLQGATIGNVVTRFPPEPSGYLHIGHAKAVLLNDYYARRYHGRLIVRFDDTNPSKEKEEFQSSILSDLSKLGVKADIVTFTSDYFHTLRSYAEYMILNGIAFMDDTPQEQMQKERMERVNSKHRDQTPEECMKLFKLMCSGDKEGAKWCLRAKIDMQSVNGTMRDPVLYRQNLTPHHRSGTEYKAYPTYDLACPIVDSLEGVTHALRTTEYNDRDEQYQWIQTALNLRRVRIHSFARMNFQYTELSKRKLTWFVENGYVTGWDDARFPTVRGVVRRGINIDALRTFICSQGASRRIVNMEWNKFWAENKKEIDKTAKRFMAIDKEKHVKLMVTNGPDNGEYAFVTTDYLPKDPSAGKRVVRIAKEVLLESIDAEGLVEGEEIVLMRWGVVKLTKVENGLEGTYIPNGNVKTAKRKLSWIANVPQSNIPCILTEFDNLLTKDKLEEDDNFKDYINPNTMATSEVIGDAGLKTLQEHDIIQLERRGYYRVDRPHVGEGKPLVLFMIPDGKAKAMSGLVGKLAHH